MGINSEFESNSVVIDEVKANLLRLADEPADLKRTLRALSQVTRALTAFGIRPILVGGQAVEVYTFGNYTTKDVDLVLIGFELAGEVLVAIGFEPKDVGHSHWYHRPLDLPIEIPDNHLMGSLERITELDVEGSIVYVIGIEDLILDRLRAGVHWQSTSDMEWAKYMLESYIDELDLTYLEAESKNRENDVFAAYQRLLADIERK